MDKITLEKFNEIQSSKSSIYEYQEQHYLSKESLEILLRYKLLGHSFNGLAPRTRAKEAKSLVCEALGYDTPKSFKKCQPRFPAQNFDLYVQKSNNLQIWNEIVDFKRRYVIVILNNDDIVTNIKVLTGYDVARLDNTGTITIKHQAILTPGNTQTELVSTQDTYTLSKYLSNKSLDVPNCSPIAPPQTGHIYPITKIYDLLKSLVGKTFPDSGHDQERNRGAELHKLICKTLGYSSFADNGQFPDVLNQLLEVKLQTSPTIDLGAFTPNSSEIISPALMTGVALAPKDVRYAIFYAQTDGTTVTLLNFYLTTGEDFFSRFPEMQGNYVNGKLQIPLPRNFFL